MFALYLEQIQNKNFAYNLDLAFFDQLGLPRLKYMAETLRQTCYQAQRVVAVVDSEFIPAIEDIWKSQMVSTPIEL